MACAMSSKMAIATPVSVKAPSASVSRSSVVVRASAQESRRAVLGGLFAGAATLAAGKASANTPVDIIDDRQAVEKGFDIIYEARDLDIPQAQRDGMSQMKGDIAATKVRVAKSSARFNEELLPLVEKKYWTLAKELLRGEIGTLRFDLNTLASTAGSKDKKKEALALRKEFITSIEELDLAIRKKDQEKAIKLYPKAQSALATALTAVGV